MFYIGISCMLIYTLSKVIHLKKVLDKKLDLKEIDHEFLNKMNN